MEPAIPTGQEILEQLNQLAGEYALSGNNSTIGGGQEGRTNAGDFGPESSSSAPAPAPTAVTPPRPAPSSPAPAPAPVTPPLAPSLASPALAPPPPASPPVVEAPISSRLRTRPERSQKWKSSMGIVPQEDKAPSKKRKAPEEPVESAKRAKPTTTKTKSVAARSAGAQPRNQKQKSASKPSMFIIYFSNLLLP